MTRTKLHFHWRDGRASRGFPVAVSLHGHTLHSRESLAFLPEVAHRIPVLRHAVAWQEERYRKRHGRAPDYASAYWTPPLNEVEALRLERRQIEDVLGLAPLVSLTDHDNIDAGLHLRLFEGSSDVPVSVEWTVPYGPAAFHVGVHNLPAEEAPLWMARLGACTAAPDAGSRRALFDGLAALPGTLLVLNHPMWRGKGLAAASHCAVVREFIVEHREWLHALELNGLRPWAENREVIDLAAAHGICIISGGDRHGAEPNGNVNLSHASTFEGFVDEVRRERRSEVLFLPQYREARRQRYAEALWDILCEYPEHPGRVRWTDRFFYRNAGGADLPLSSVCGGDGPGVISLFMAALRFTRSEPLRTRIRAALRAGGEVLP